MDKICKTEGCGRSNVWAKGLCSKCYSKHWRAKQPPKPRPKKDKPCSVEGCPRVMHAKGLCKKHYQVQRVLLRPEAFKTYQKRSRDNHKEKRKETARLWAEKNRDRVKETARAWSKTSEGRAKIRAQVARRRACRLGLKHPDVPDALRTFCCALCGSPPPSAVDHILPLSWAGHSPEANACLEDPACYQPLCKSCNSTKSNRYVWALVPTGDIGDP